MEIPDGRHDSGVKNDGMSDQQNQSQQRAGGGRPSSAKSNRERQERIVLLKEKQDSDRLKKLEELKEQAIAAARLREEQDSRRKKHFEELVKKEDDRRRQAEERRRLLDEERKLAIQGKWESKKNSSMTTSVTTPSRPGSARPTFAFGSCTPRLVDNHADGFMYRSQYNLNVTREPGGRASSAQDLHLQQKEVRMSASMYDWNQQKTTIDNPLVTSSNGHRNDRRQQAKSRSNYDGADTMRMFCGRRKTDLTPTIPIRRDNYDMSMMSRSTSRGSGRVYSSMTRLDRSRSPGGGNLSLGQHQHQVQRPSRSKSTTHLSSTGLKLTRTEILRQALAAKKDSGGFRSVDQSRPPSSMSSSIMTSSTHSQVQMRPRNLTRKSRPASVHVTGVSIDTSNHEPSSFRNAQRRRTETSQERKPLTNPLPPARKLEPKKASGKTSPSPTSASQPGETSTIKRPVKKLFSATKDKPPASASANGAKPASVNGTSKPNTDTLVTSATPEPVVANAAAAVETNPFLQNPEDIPKLINEQPQNLNDNEFVSNQVEVVEVINNSKNEFNTKVENQMVIENFESIESAFASGSDDFAFSSKTPEPFSPTPTNFDRDEEVKNIKMSAMDDLLGNDLDFTNANSTEILAKAPEALNIPQTVEIKSVSPVPDSKGQEDSAKSKPRTEEEAKAAVSEKRRLAREAAEREAARLEEEQRLEEERQRLEAEEADRFVREARAAEEERLRIAIEEQQKKEAEEKVRREEEEKARAEKEKQDREAAREAERIRLEMEERLKREEEERLERRKRVEAIMARTRKKEAEQQANANPAETNPETEPINGHKENNVSAGEINVQSSNNSLNNNYNNNNDFGVNDSTLITFDGMGGQETNNLVENTTGLLSNSSASNPIITNPLQDLLS